MRRGVMAELAKKRPTYNAGTTSATTVKPYFILRFDTPIESDMFGRFTNFTVICYANKGNALELDAICEEAKTALDKKRISRTSDGTKFIPEFTGNTDDFTDDVLKALTKEMRFRVPAFGNEFM